MKNKEKLYQEAVSHIRKGQSHIINMYYHTYHQYNDLNTYLCKLCSKPCKIRHKHSSPISAVLSTLYIFDCHPHFLSNLTFQKINRGTEKGYLRPTPKSFYCPRIMSMSNFNIFILWHGDKDTKLIIHNTIPPLNSPDLIQNYSY